MSSPQLFPALTSSNTEFPRIGNVVGAIRLRGIDRCRVYVAQARNTTVKVVVVSAFAILGNRACRISFMDISALSKRTAASVQLSSRVRSGQRKGAGFASQEQEQEQESRTRPPPPSSNTSFIPPPVQYPQPPPQAASTRPLSSPCSPPSDAPQYGE